MIHCVWITLCCIDYLRSKNSQTTSRCGQAIKFIIFINQIMTCLHLTDNVHFTLSRSGCHSTSTSNFDTTLIKKKNRKDDRYLFRYQGKKGQKVSSMQNRTVFFFLEHQLAHTAGAEKVLEHKPTATFAVTSSSA